MLILYIRPALFDGGDLPPRIKWRTAQLTARQFDRLFPFWWNDTILVLSFLAQLAPEYRRMWEQLIAQRYGL